MKAAGAIFLGLFVCASVLAQGSVHFGNTPTTLITSNFNSQSGPIQGAGTFQFGLWVTDFGQALDTMVLVAITTSTAVNGRFDGGNVSLAPMWVPGNTLSFQVRGWSTLFGQQYYDHPVYYGDSAIGFFTLSSSVTPIEIFGSGPGQIGGFVIQGVPEPSTGALVFAGVVVCFFTRRRCLA